MKIPSTNLFDLIKSMTTQEKVYLKIKANEKKSKNNYILLFDAVNSLKEYNESEIKRKLLPYNITNLKALKSYTIEIILNSLQEYYSSDSPYAQVSNYIQQIEILIKKELYGFAYNLLNKAKAKAKKHFLFDQLNTLMIMESTLSIRTGHLKYINKSIELYPQIKKNNTIIEDIHHHSLIRLQISKSGYQEASKSSEIKAKLNVLLNNYLKSSKTLSTPAKLLYYFNKGNIYYRLLELKQSLIMHKKADKVFEKYPVLKINYSLMHVTNINNICGVLVNLKMYDDLSMYFNKIKLFKQQLPSKFYYQQLQSKFDISFIMELIYLIKLFKLEEAIQISKQYNFDETLAPPISYITYHANMFLVYFYIEDYSEALQHCNKILDFKTKNSREDITDSFKLINIIIHYEKGNDFMLSNISSSCYRYFKLKKSDMLPTIKLFTDAFNVLPYTNGKEKKEVFIMLKSQLLLIDNKLGNAFNFFAWLDSKIENRPLVEVVREREK